MLGLADKVEKIIFASFRDEKTKRNYLQAYQGRMKQLLR
jgi:serine/threonine-protein kinase HipA